MQDKMQNTAAIGQITSSIQNKCTYCGGDGLYTFMQLASEYAKERGVEDIYASRPQPYYIPVGKKCPYCNGGLAEDVKLVRKNSDIPTTFYDKRMKDFDWNAYVKDDGTLIDTTSTRKGVEAFINQFDVWEKKNIGLYICGRTKGSGKTFLASCICNELMYSRAIKTRFIRASELIDISQSGDKNAYDEYKRNPIKLLYECKLLVIDDIGQKNTGMEWLEDEMFKLLDYRMTNGRMTLVTSNLDIKQLPFNERIKDRLEKITVEMHLPEICVRTKEARENRQALFKELGLIGDRKE